MSSADLATSLIRCGQVVAGSSHPGFLLAAFLNHDYKPLSKDRTYHLQGQWQAERGVPDVRLPKQIKLTPFASPPGLKTSPRDAPQATQVNRVFVGRSFLAGKSKLYVYLFGYNSYYTTSDLDLQETFNWRAQWYPVAVVGDLDPSRPHATKLLGMHPLVPQKPLNIDRPGDVLRLLVGDDLVLMNDEDNIWRCLEDKCPHRYR